MNYLPYIQIAADTIESLREQDVFRVLDCTSEAVRPDVAAYIIQHRPEFKTEVCEVMADEFFHVMEA